MKYTLLIATDESADEAMSPDEVQAQFQGYMEFGETMTKRGVLTGTFASRISRLGTGGNCERAGDCLSRADSCADRDGAQQERTCDGSERASELRLTKHL